MISTREKLFCPGELARGKYPNLWPEHYNDFADYNDVLVLILALCSQEWARPALVLCLGPGQTRIVEVPLHYLEVLE